MFNGIKKLFLVWLLPIVVLAQGTNVTGSYRLFHVQEARTFEKGRLVLYSNMNFNTDTREAYTDGGGATVPGVNYWNNQGNIAISYGLMNHFDASLILRLYQDTQTGEKSNLPQNLDLALKFGNYELGSPQFRWGLTADLLIGLGDYNDVLFETYDPGGVQFGIGGLISYYTDPYLPDKAFSTHINFSYWNFNDLGQSLRGRTSGSGAEATSNASALRYGIGGNIPLDMFDIVVELWGSSFMTKPDEFAYGVEDYFYLTPGFKYYPLNWMTVNFGFDLLLQGADEQTIPPPSSDFAYPSNFSAWKIQLGLDFKIAPLSHGVSEAEIERRQFNDKVEFFESVIEERRRTETIDDELDKLKKQRRQAEKELEELRQLLDEQDQ